MSYVSEFYDSQIKPNQNLSVYQSGWQKCGSGHSYGPSLRDHYVIHYIIKGQGIYRCENKQYELVENQGFLIPPNKSTFYKANDKNPWEYYWVGFHGSDAKKLLSLINLNEDSLIFTYDKDNKVEEILRNLYFSSKQYESREYAMLGYLYLFFSKMLSKSQYARKPSEEYIQKAVEYMENNYTYPINVTNIAKHVGIERSYLYRLFQSEFQCSVYDYFLNLRLDKAQHMMINSNISITQIAISHGFTNVSHFSKVFKKKYGMCPNNYKKKFCKS